jgi:hypothetical protein
MCPKGDDPFTYFSDYRAIIIVLNAYSATFTGSFKLTYDALGVSIPSTGWTNEECQEAFQALPAFKTVRCSLSYATTRYGGFSLQVEFIEFEPVPYQNNIYYHEGNPPLSAFKCDTRGITTAGTVSCEITDVSYNSLPGTTRLLTFPPERTVIVLRIPYIVWLLLWHRVRVLLQPRYVRHQHWPLQVLR